MRLFSGSGLAMGFALLAVLCDGAACREKKEEEKTMEPVKTAPMPKKVIDSPVAGSWYTDNPTALRREIQGYLDAADVTEAQRMPGRIVGIISPHAGYRYSGAVAGYGYKLLVGQKIERVIVLGPSHRVGFSGVAFPDATHWRTPLGEVEIDREAISRLATESVFQRRSDTFAVEHSVDIQVPFLQVVAPGAKLVPLVVGRLSPGDIRAAGKAIRGLLDDRTVVVASSDFTHYGPNYGYTPFSVSEAEARLKALGDGALAAIRAMNTDAFDRHLDQTGDTICGHYPISILMVAVPQRADVVPLKFDTSGRMTRDFENSVSYFSIAFSLGPNRAVFRGVHFLDEPAQKYLLSLARDTIRRHLADKPLPAPQESEVPEQARPKYGVFVTLKKHGDLRGCIGSILPDEPLYKGVIRNAVNASTEDSRFSPMTLAEEPLVDIEISVLTPPREVLGAEDIALGRDGVILGKGRNRAVFLPQVAPEQGWDLETMLAHLSLKAGLSANAWKSGATFQTFQAQVFGEKEEPVH